MISSVAGWCAGALVVFIGWRATRTVFTGYVFQRHNYRDHQLPTAAGVLICLGAAAVVAANEVVGSTWASVAGPSGWFSVVTYGPAVVALVVGFGFLGLIDDLGGTGESGGFRGHFRALAHGRLTTGAIKAFGGPVIALSIIPLNLSTDGVGRLRDAAIICLSANLVNLLDRAPGRAIKIGLIFNCSAVMR